MSGAPKKVKLPLENPLDERGFPKRFREDPLQYIYERNKPQSPGAMGGATGINMTPKQRKQLEEEKKALKNKKKKKTIMNKDGGLMEAIKRVDAEKEQRLQDGGMVGNLTSNFKGFY